MGKRKNLCMILWAAVFGTALTACSQTAAAPGRGQTEAENGTVYEEMMNVFDEATLPSDEYEYPEYYGGSYTDENGRLVVYVTRKYSGDAGELRARFGSRVDYRECDYSYNTLNSLVDELNDFMLKEGDQALAQNIESFSLVEEDNRIVVRLRDFSDSQIQVFREKISDSGAIVLEETSDLDSPVFS